jgi:hypothetical protein
MVNFSLVALKLLLFKKPLLAKSTSRMRLPFMGLQHMGQEGRSSVKVPMSLLLITETERFEYNIHKFGGGY